MADNGYIQGDPWVICDRSGFRVRKSETVKEWTGLVVAKRYSEERHPQDFVRGRAENMAVEDARPDSDPIFLSVGEVTENDL